MRSPFTFAQYPHSADRFLALAADVYAKHLELRHARLERADKLRKAREAQG